ncbi:lipopolysaccharide assembly protein LapA domain-containing protein [Vagococcus sp. PNs007]|uniref:Lipopolysaccharide assembly protein LapA domain-containing protein n=1 Tax=Vagococcus proximus TaxID=2991417 RepID=A0ABT5WYQ6_9ENTE|nr:lipopolysaccharide assembly protein LapA domain-containing protein [Vagococcus proximus]
MKDHGKLITGFLLVCVVVIFSVINTRRVVVNFGIAEITSPLIFIILGSAILGALIVFITWFSNFWKQRKELKSLKNELKDLKENFDAKMSDAVIDIKAELATKDEEVKMLETRLENLTREQEVELDTTASFINEEI